MKRCTKCGIEKAVTEYYSSKHAKCGLLPACKVCEKKKVKLYQQQHREQCRERYLKYKLRHPDRLKELSKQSRARTVEHRREYNRRHAKNNPEMYNIRWHNRQARIRGNGGTFTVTEWFALKEKYDFCCLSCGNSESHTRLTADHIVPLLLGGSNSISNIQPLCQSCNSAKHTQIIDYRIKNGTRCSERSKYQLTGYNKGRD